MSYKSIEVSGKTEEEAIEKALEELSMDRDHVSIEVVARAKSGFLGLKLSPAVIKVTYEVDDTEITSQAAESQAPSEVAVDPAGQDDAVRRAEAFLVGLLERMNVAAIPVMDMNERGISVDLKGEDIGSLIGRRGETLDAMQHLTNYSVNRGMESRVRINIDAENYRQKREEALENLARRMAEKAVKFRRSFTFEPMNAYERHVIHTTLQTNDLVKTYSTGSEPGRRVVVSYVGEEH